jgi:hypothetical protein
VVLQLGVGRGLTTPDHKKHVTKCHKGPRTWTNYLDRRKMDMGFGTWDVRSLYMAGSLITVGKKHQIISYISWEYRRSDGTGVATNQQANTHFFYGKGNDNHEFGTVSFFTSENLISS